MCGVFGSILKIRQSGGVAPDFAQRRLRDALVASGGMSSLRTTLSTLPKA